jgi:protein-tyrosine phosphatase
LYLLRKKIVNFIASDAHSMRERRPVLSEAVKIAGTIIGNDRASHLVTLNPEKVIAGKAVGV